MPKKTITVKLYQCSECGEWVPSYYIDGSKCLLCAREFFNMIDREIENEDESEEHDA